MSHKFSEAEVLEYNEEGVSSRTLLLYERPGADKKFHKICKDLENYLKWVQEVFPDACFYTASGGLHVLLGKSHSEGGRSQQTLAAIGRATNLVIGDGDF